MTAALTQHTMALQHVKYPGYSFFIQGDFSKDTTPCYLQAQFTARCSRTGKVGPQRTRKWLLSEHMTRSEIVQTALMCVLASQEHETRGSFTYMGRAIFGPHYEVEDLVGICDDGRAVAGGRHDDRA